ncbi:gag-pol polyprotein [Tanacetum coccineum]
MSDMTACLNDLSYIPLNNEQNKPTQGDIGETCNEPTQAIRNEFEELYVSANEELYPGCDYVTRLDFMTKFTHFKVKGKLTNSIFNEILEFFQFVFPPSKGYKLPPSYYAIKKTFKTIGLGYESIHACVNDCFLFRGEDNKDKQLCLSSHTAKEMTWHATGKCIEPGKMQHPVDDRAWKKFDTRQSYNMWPVILKTYNLPPWLCMKESYLMLTLLIPCPESPGKDIDVYLRPLIDDLKNLWALKGVETKDVATGQKFNMRAMVLWTINDFPARSSLSGWSGQGYMACPTCNEDTPSMRVLRKIAYVGHIRFLKNPHKWRRSCNFNGETEDGDPPRKFNRAQIQTKLDRLPTLEKGKHLSYGGVKIKRNVLVELNWTKISIFYELKSNFKHKVTDNDSNITGLKSHDCHIMMQHLLPYGLQQYLPSSVATPIIKLCSFFKQICSRTLMEADMVKSQRQVINIMCNLELIYTPAFFDIMNHLVIHLPLEALEGGPIPPGGYPSTLHRKRPGVSESDVLFTLACGPTPSPFSVNSCVVNGVRFVVHSCDEHRTTQNSGICSPGEKDGELYYGQLEEILEFSYMSFKVVLFRVKWFDTRNEGRKIKRFVIRNNITQIWARGESFKDDQYILATQVKQVFYLEDMARRPPDWKVVQDVNHKKVSNGGVIVVEDDHDVIHFDNSSDLALSTSLDDLDFTTLNIDGQSMDVDAPPDIIDADEDNDLIDDEDTLPHDLADSDDEDL